MKSPLKMATLLLITLACWGCEGGDVGKAGKKKKRDESGSESKLQSTPFAERNTDDVFNASGIVEIGDGRFLFCDNNDMTSVFELHLNADGNQAGSITRRPLEFGAPVAFDDLEDLSLVSTGGQSFVVGTTSLLTREKKGETRVPHGGLLRARLTPDGPLPSELMLDFRAWLVAASPLVGSSADREPDDGGLNIEGLAWDSASGSLLLGLRTPDLDGKPCVLPVRVKDIAGEWATSNLELGEPIRLQVAAEEVGVRGMSADATRGGFLVLVGNSTSRSKADFELYRWDGGREGRVEKVPVTFSGKIKPEGVTRASLGGSPVIVVTDDGGGFLVITGH